MPTGQDVARQRALLATVRTQFSSEVQTIKQSALDKIGKNILYSAPDRQWMTPHQVREAFRQDSGGYVLNEMDVDSSLSRLLADGVVESQVKRGSRRYRLNDQARDELAQTMAAADRRFDSVLRRLFGSDAHGHRRYRNCFIDFLSAIFGALGEESARLIYRGGDGEGALSAGLVGQTLATARRTCPGLDHDLFAASVATFFREDDPEYNEIKWNLAQNLFVAKALGLDPTGALLSREMFQDAMFYLDTNLLIAALEPTHRGHRWFQSLVTSARELNARLSLCAPTLSELEAWLARQRSDFGKVGSMIPESIAPEVDSLFLEKFETARRRGEHLTIDEVFASFDNPKRTLIDQYGVEVVDDIWFHEANLDGGIDRFATALQERQRVANFRGQKKKLGAARHDAKALTWVEQQRAGAPNGVWLVTTDRTLPRAVPEKSEASSLAITAAALLQWISPVIGPPGGNGTFASGFAQMVRERILPRDRFLDLQDFLVFHEMHISIKDLPEEDVRRTLREIKAQAPHLDQSDPADLQVISRIVARNLVDPGSKHNQEIARIEQKLALERAEREQASLRMAEELKSTQRSLAAERDRREQAEQEHQQERSSLELSLKESVETIKRQSEHDKLLSEAKVRLIVVFGVLVVALLATVFLSNRYESGPNLYQKVRNSSFYIGAVIAFFLALGGWWIGKKRLAAIGWPFASWLKASD